MTGASSTLILKPSVDPAKDAEMFDETHSLPGPWNIWEWEQGVTERERLGIPDMFTLRECEQSTHGRSIPKSRP